jgi:hypothetical protein
MHTEILLLAGAVAAAFFALSINRGLKMRDDKRPLAELLWYAGGLIPLAGVCLFWASMGDQPVTPQRIILFVIGAAIGGFALLAAGEWIRPTLAQNNPPISTPGGATQNNQSGPNFNVPGSGNQINIYPPTAPQAAAGDSISQAGVVVGQAFGGRRSPTDATIFEFQEVTHAQQFNVDAPFQYQGHTLRAVRIETTVGLDSSRPQDGRIIYLMTAKVIE